MSAVRAATSEEIVTLARLGRILEKYAGPELTLTQYRMLVLIAGGDSRASRLARKLVIGKPSVTAAVEVLEAKGLVVRSQLDEDRRGSLLAVTPSGTRMIAEVTGSLGQILGDVIERCEDPRAVRDALAQLAIALEARAEQRDVTAVTTKGQ
nr:MarR family winged helix-turn-helix transcriptional regulator [Micromonospora sp. DSM 115978]